jgi:hypothetical protein
MTSKTAGVSLAQLDARKASETPFEFEYIDPKGNLSGIFLSVIGSHSDAMKKAMVASVDEQRRKDLVRAAKNAKARPESAEIGSFAEDIDSGTRQAALRLVSWRAPGDTDGLTAEQLERFQGIVEPWSTENALLLCRINPEISAQVMERSNDLGNWLSVSPPTS